jgi:glycosyltransferase involved in cell wall biosynthesis
VTVPLQGDLVSVVLPTYNRAATLPRAIYSILNQTYRNIELLVIDDASTDDTAAVVGAIDDPRVRYVRLDRNRGQSGARNEGMRLSTGAFIAFQDSDDEWLVEKLEKQVSAAKAAGSEVVSVFHMRLLYGRDEGRTYGPGRVCCVPVVGASGEPIDFIKATHRQNLISPQTLLVSRACFEKVGFFDTTLRTSPDWDYSIRLAYNSKVVYLPEPLVVAYIQDDSISRMTKAAARSQLRILLKLQDYSDVDPAVLSEHFGRIGMTLSRIGRPRFAARLLRRSIQLTPGQPKAWGRLAASTARAVGIRRSV